MWGHLNSFIPFHLGLLRNRGFCSSIEILGGKPWEAVPHLRGGKWGSALEFIVGHPSDSGESECGFEPISLLSSPVSPLDLSGDLMPGQLGWGLVSAQLGCCCCCCCYYYYLAPLLFPVLSADVWHPQDQHNLGGTTFYGISVLPYLLWAHASFSVPLWHHDYRPSVLETNSGQARPPPAAQHQPACLPVPPVCF